MLEKSLKYTGIDVWAAVPESLMTYLTNHLNNYLNKAFVVESSGINSVLNWLTSIFEHSYIFVECIHFL